MSHRTGVTRERVRAIQMYAVCCTGRLSGVTQLDNMLYVVTYESSNAVSSTIRTLSVDTLSSLGDIHVQGMKAPNDIVVCHHDRQLYVTDSAFMDNCIWRVSADDHSYVKWLPTESTTDTFKVISLSVTSRGLLVTSSQDPSLSLREYSMTDRQLLRVVQLPGYVKYLYHGVETTRGTFLIGHRGTSQDHRQFAVSCRRISTLVLMHFNYTN